MKLFNLMVAFLLPFTFFVKPIEIKAEPIEACPTEVVTDDFGNSYCMPEVVYIDDVLQNEYRNLIRSNFVTQEDIDLLVKIAQEQNDITDLLLFGSLEEKFEHLYDFFDYAIYSGAGQKAFAGSINCLLGGDFALYKGCVPQLNEAIKETEPGSQNYKNYYNNQNTNNIFASGDTTYNNVYNSNDNSINFKYEIGDITVNQTYDIDNYYYNFVNNTYNYITNNNVVFAVTNNYNNTTVNVTGLSGLDGTYKYYYKMPDGSNSYNLTEEQIKGYRTDFYIENYNDIYDYDNLISLFHFDGNKKDSAYLRPSGNGSFSISPNTITYLTSDNYNFGSYLYIGAGKNDITINTSNGNHFDFRFYPTYSNNFNFSVNGTQIFDRFNSIVTDVYYEESTSLNEVISYVTVTSNTVPTVASVCPPGHSQTSSRLSYTEVSDGIYSSTFRCEYTQENKTQMPFVNNTVITTSDEVTNNLRFGEWNQLTFLTDSSNIYLYINGKYIQSYPVAKNESGEYVLTLEQDGYSYFDELRIKGTSFNNSDPSLIYYMADEENTESMPQVFIDYIKANGSKYNLIQWQRNWGNIALVNTSNSISSNGAVQYSTGIAVTSDGSVVNLDNGGTIQVGSYNTPGNANAVMIKCPSSLGSPCPFDYTDKIGNWTTYYDVTVNVSPLASGSVTGGGTYEENEQVTLTATAVDGYVFDSWSNGSTANPLVFTAVEDVNITANFVEAAVTEYVLNVNQVTGGTINVIKNDVNNYTATFVSDDNYTFNYFSLNGIQYTSNPFTFSISTDSNLTANASYSEPEEEQFTLDIIQIDSGQINCSNNSLNNYTCAFVPYSDYAFQYFVINGTNITSNPFTFDLVQNSTLTAKTQYIGTDPIDPELPPTQEGTGPIFNFIPPSLPYDTNLIYVLPDTDTNNKILVQSTIGVTDWQIGGVRPSVYSYGFVYIYVDENGLMKSVQQYDGSDWIDVNASLYSSNLEKWVSYYNYSIFMNNWSFTDVDTINPSDIKDNVTFYEWLGGWFNKIYEVLKDISMDSINASLDDSQNNSVQNNNNQNNILDNTVNDLEMIETEFKNDFDNNLNNIDTVFPFGEITDFTNTAIFVRNQFDYLVGGNPFGSLLGFSLLLGLSLLIIGKRL